MTEEKIVLYSKLLYIFNEQNWNVAVNWQCDENFATTCQNKINSSQLVDTRGLRV